MTQIKICGITRREDALLAAECGADALGFIFYPASPRHVTPETARSIIRDLPEGIVRVGVFVNQNPFEVINTTHFCSLDLIQLHGDESPADCRRFPAERLIKAVSSGTKKDPETLAGYPVRAILLDHREAECYGGTGKLSDWELARRIRDAFPLILAGGLREINIVEAIQVVAPDAVDLNSGIEESPGQKDPEKIRNIIKMIRSINDDKAIARSERPFRCFRGPLCR